MATARQIALNKQLVQGWSYDDVLRVTEDNLSEFNLVNCTTALCRLAKADRGCERPRAETESRLLTRTAELVQRLGNGCPPQNLANALHACERLGLRGEAADALATVARSAVAHAGRLKAFSGQHLANVAWACAKLGGPFGPFAAALAARSKDLNAQELSMTAWALATASTQSEGGEAIAALVSRSLSHGVRGLSAQQLATLAWACAKLGHQDAAFLAEVAQAAPARIRAGEFNEQDLANCAWAFGRLEHQAPELMEETSRRVDALLAQRGRKREGFSPQQLSMLAWSISRLSPRNTASMSAIVQEAHRRLSEFSPRDLTDLVWAIAKVDLKAPEFLEAAGIVAKTRQADFNSQEQLKFLGAFRRAGGSSSVLRELSSAQQTLEHTFAGLGGLQVVLTAETPGQRPGSRRKKTQSGAVEDGHEGDPQRSDGGTTGVALWEASFVLAEWLSRQAKGPRASRELDSVLPKKKIWRRWLGKKGVELGAGLGLPSIIAAQLGVEMIATDGDASVLRLLRGNCERNAPSGCGSLRAECLLWGADDPLQILGLKRPPDLLLASDVVYASAGERLTQMLTETLLALTDTNTLVLMSNVRRFPVGHARGEERFFAALERVFMRTTLPVSALHPEHRRSGAGGCTVHALRRRPSVLARPLPQGPAACEGAPQRKRALEVASSVQKHHPTALLKKGTKKKKRTREEILARPRAVVDDAPRQIGDEVCHQKKKALAPTPFAPSLVGTPASPPLDTRVKKRKRRKVGVDTQ